MPPTATPCCRGAPPPGATEAPPVPPFMPLAAPPAGGRSADYLRGYRDAVLHLTEEPAPGAGAAALAEIAALDESQATWGLQATKVVNCCRSGAKIRVAVLDTGFDLEHPDFAGRTIQSRSFVPGEAVQDGHGHGTHCIGTALGRKCPPAGRPRYGVAHGAEIYAGKVLSNAGSGSDTGILAGIEWAIANKCAVVSMSLGAPTRPGQPFSQVYERVALRAQAMGTLIVAAAGNDSSRPGLTNPVSHPANCPSIMAVAALDPALAVASFSNRGINPDGGQIDIAAPGRERVLQLADADALPAAAGHEHGDAARRGDRGALRGRRPDGPRRGALARAGRRRPAAAAARHRRRRGAGAGAVIDVTVLVADDHLDTIGDVAAALQEAGLRLQATMPATGVITGAAEDPAALAGVPGVAAVETARDLRVPPPDSPLQ